MRFTKDPREWIRDYWRRRPHRTITKWDTVVETAEHMLNTGQIKTWDQFNLFMTMNFHQLGDHMHDVIGHRDVVQVKVIEHHAVIEEESKPEAIIDV